MVISFISIIHSILLAKQSRENVLTYILTQMLISWGYIATILIRKIRRFSILPFFCIRNCNIVCGIWPLLQNPDEIVANGTYMHLYNAVFAHAFNVILKYLGLFLLMTLCE